MAKTTKTRAGDGPATEVETLRHPADVTRRNIPTAETSALMAAEEAAAKPMLYPRNPDLDPQLVWRGKDAQDAAPLSVETVPIYIQEKVLPEALIRDLQRQSKQGTEPQADLFGESHDSRRLAASDGQPRPTRRPSGQGADDLSRPALRNTFCKQLAA